MTAFGLPYSLVQHDGAAAGGSRWPVGALAAPHENFAAILLHAAHFHAHEALRLFVSDDRFELLQAAVSAGTAVEIACKAAVAQIEPTLIAERADRDTLLRLSGKGHRASTPATRIRTVGGLAAFRLVRHLHRALSVPESAAEAALEVRNAAIHMALVDRTEVRAAASAMSRVVDAVVEAMEASRADFWGERVVLVDNFIRVERETVEQIVEAKVAAARSRLSALVSRLDAATAASVLSALSRKRSHADHEEPVPCPVCGQQAWLICSTENGEVEWTWDEDGLAGTNVEITAYPFAFDCSVCGLELEVDELAHLKMDAEIELGERDVDPADYYEPDEDMWRDR